MTAAQSVARTKRTRRVIRVAKIGAARDALAGLTRHGELYCLTHGQFSLMDAVEALLDTTGPADVAISTWTAAAADLSRSAEHLRDRRIRSLRFVVDCSFPQRQPGYAAQLVELFGVDAIRTTRTHAKFVTITNSAWNIACRTSMNLNENPRLEHIEISDDPALCGFLNSVVDAIFTEERPGDWKTKSTPTLTAIPGVQPTSAVSDLGAVSQLGTVRP